MLTVVFDVVIDPALESPGGAKVTVELTLQVTGGSGGGFTLAALALAPVATTRPTGIAIAAAIKAILR
ncbi:MAG: hypothetical protein ACRDYE_01170, partial [Acidimicrobiales bacterium]